MKEDEIMLGVYLHAIVKVRIENLDTLISQMTITTMSDKSVNQIRESYKKEKRVLTEYLNDLKG